MEPHAPRRRSGPIPRRSRSRRPAASRARARRSRSTPRRASAKAHGSWSREQAPSRPRCRTRRSGRWASRSPSGTSSSSAAGSSPDALLPWNGSTRATEKPNQPLYVRVTVPDGTAPGTYRGTIAVSADGRTVAVPLTVRVHRVAVPAAGNPDGNMLTRSTSSRRRTSTRSTRCTASAATRSARRSTGRCSAGSPTTASRRRRGASASHAMRGGYSGEPSWWLDSAGNMTGRGRAHVLRDARPDLEQPAARPTIAGVSPFAARALVRLPRRRPRLLGSSRAGCARRSRTSTRSTSPTSRASASSRGSRRRLHDVLPRREVS